jgi:ribulose kinase
MTYYYLAIDIGTESARAAVFRGDGLKVGDGSCGYPTTFPAPGWAEQDPVQWWESAAMAGRQALEEAGTKKVDAVSIATTASSVVFLDRHQKPLRPALLWMDSRSDEQSEMTARVDHEAFRYSGGSASSEWLVPKAMWVAQNEPDIYAASAYIGEAVDYLNLRLTGEWSGSRLNATCKWNYDHRQGDVPHDLYALLGVSDLGSKLPQRILELGAPVGPMSAEAAEKLGLINRPVVATGGIDAHLTLVPLRGLSRNPVSIVAGTSNAFIAELDEPVFSPTLWGPYPGAMTHGRWLVEGGQVSAGSSLTWLAERVLGFGRDRIQALISEALVLPPVTHGLMVLDNFMGNRTPLRDPKLRGAILGLTIGTTPAELYRANVESVAFGTRQVLDSFTSSGVDSSDIFITGGIQHNSLWLQTTADVLRQPISLVENENMTLRACAALCAFASGHHASLDAAAAMFSPSVRVVDPNDAVAPQFEDAYNIYLEATAATTDIHHRLHDIGTRRYERTTIGGNLS